MSSSTEQQGNAHQWTGNCVNLTAGRLRAERLLFSQVKLDLSVLGIKRNGLLEACINDLTCPIASSIASTFAECISAISADIGIAKILSTPPAELSRSDIFSLFISIDNHYSAKKTKSLAAQAEKARNVIRDCQSTLKDGIGLAQVGYKTRLKSPKRHYRKDISDLVDDGAETNEIKLPLSANTKNNVTQFTGDSEEHYRKRLDRIVATCEEVLDEHESVKQVVDAARRMPIPQSLSKNSAKMLKEFGRIDGKVANRRTAEERLIIAIKVVDHAKLYSHAPAKLRVYIDDIPVLDLLSGNKGTRTRFGVLLSSHYLSRFAVTACFVILLRYTQWNPDALARLSADRITQTPHGYRLVSLKGKTEKHQEADVISDDSTVNIEERAAVRAIKLLLWHNRSVDKFAQRDSKSVFVSMRLSYSNRLQFDVFTTGKHFHEFTDTWGLPKFTATDIRPQTVRHGYLQSGGDLASQQAILGHASSATTRHYLGGIDIAHNESNIKRFGEMLEASIFYVTKRKDVDSRFSDEDAKTIRAMLAPPTRFASNEDEYLIDVWLANPAGTRIPVNEALVEQCVYQHAYYVKNFRKIHLTNPARFLKSELPRILVCIALYRILKEGQFRRKVHALEVKINA
jgi:hypothetical protein